MQELKSIFDTLPTDYGGINARLGFAFQDDVAAGFYIMLLEQDNLLEVSCESYDDIVLIRKVNDKKVAEFVQVKA